MYKILAKHKKNSQFNEEQPSRTKNQQDIFNAFLIYIYIYIYIRQPLTEQLQVILVFMF